jgi:hypothetical protein
LAALTLLNDPTCVEAARVFAARILQEGGDTTDSRLAYAYRRALSRLPDDVEQHTLEELLDASREHYATQRDGAGQLVQVGLSPRVANLDPVELAAWTAVARAILNLNEAITRN